MRKAYVAMIPWQNHLAWKQKSNHMGNVQHSNKEQHRDQHSGIIIRTFKHKKYLDTDYEVLIVSYSKKKFITLSDLWNGRASDVRSKKWQLTATLITRSASSVGLITLNESCEGSTVTDLFGVNCAHRRTNETFTQYAKRHRSLLLSMFRYLFFKRLVISFL